MIIRSLEATDVTLLKEIHEKHWQDEFVFPDFLNQYHCVFTVEDVGGIITIGGVRPIAECVTVTNKDRDPKIRLEALFKILDASMFTAGRYRYDQLHAFVQDKRWSNRLKKHGFQPTKGESLVLDI
jgi:hypothetical protein